MNELELLRYQVESYNKSILKILEDINKRLNTLENEVDDLWRDLNVANSIIKK